MRRLTTGDMRFFKSRGKTMRERRRHENITENLRIILLE
jgi:hypothetical protein